jgi:AGZA family xanthine/uracil permease-like MFS transporter
VESAETAGDSFPLRRVLAGSGVVTLIGCLLGCPFVNGIHVGQPGWKALGGRTGYAAGAGIAILLAGCLGVTSLATALVPPVALMPLLLVAGILTVSRAFHDSPARYIPAFLLAMIPALAGWAKAQVDNGLGATGTAVDMLGIDKLYGEGVVYPGLQALGDGPTLVGIVLGALAVFVIDRKFMHATTTALVGAVLTFFGMMHAESFFGAIHAEAVGIGRSPQLVIAYLAAAVVLFLATRHAKRAT